MLKNIKSVVSHVSKRYRLTAITLTTIASILFMLIKQMFTDQGNPINYILMAVIAALFILLIKAIRDDKRYYDDKLKGKKEYRNSVNKVRKLKAEREAIKLRRNDASNHPDKANDRRPPS